MPNTNYIRFKIGNRIIDVEDIESLPLAIDYALEDPENFEQKKSSEAYNITLPATLDNSQTFNSPANLAAEDLTLDDFFTNHQPCVIEANGIELLKGKAFLVEATHTDRPEKITVNCYGNNADWLIDLKEKTLWDFVSQVSHLFNASVIEDSWAFNGNSEILDYVYAPVRYKAAFDSLGTLEDFAATPFLMKPAISKYWLLYRALKSVGYKIQSAFLDSPFFRRQVMPWTWGNFLYTDDAVQAPYLFRALCTQQEIQTGYAGNWNEWVSPAGASVVQKLSWTDKTSGGAMGGFENTPGSYSFNHTRQMSYVYPVGSILGKVTLGFALDLYYYIYIASGTHSFAIRAYWFRNLSPLVSNPNPLDAVAIIDVFQYNGNGIKEGVASVTQELVADPGDKITCILRIDAGNPGANSWNWKIGNPSAASTFPVSFLQLIYLKKALGSPVRFQDFPEFKKHKWLDLLRGIIDEFNLSITTDPVTKTVYIEPTHDYYTGNNPNAKLQGYLGKGDLDWRHKQDLSKESVLQLYSDNEREFNFKYQDDGNDGGANILNKRYAVEIGSARYLFPDRFKAGKKEYLNRFFTPVVHVNMQQWGSVTGVNPQLIALIPENVANTSQRDEAGTFGPKSAYYKGNVTGAGGWVWQPNPNDPATIQSLTSIPFMFAVNYMSGGDGDPVLAYNDQRIGEVVGSSGVRAHGLLRKFFLQRLAIMRHGRLYKTFMRLELNDVTNWLHREAIIIGGKKYFLIGIEKFQPLKEETTQVILWQWEPMTAKDDAAVFPSRNSVLTVPNTTLASSDLKYARQIILYTDLPQNP